MSEALSHDANSSSGWLEFRDGAWRPAIGAIDIEPRSCFAGRFCQFKRGCRRLRQRGELGGIDGHNERTMLGGHDGEIGVTAAVIWFECDADSRETSEIFGGGYLNRRGGDAVGDLNGGIPVDDQATLSAVDGYAANDGIGPVADIDVSVGDDGHGDVLSDDEGEEA